MKMLLLLLSGCFMFGARAQNDGNSLQRKGSVETFREMLERKRMETALRDSNIVLNATPFLKNKRPGVHILPQDNMPCIVPDSTKTVKIPNAWRGSLRVPYKSKPPQIPNPRRQQWRPFPITNSGTANEETATK